MKILYIAHERDAAAVAARVLHGTAPNITLAWVQTPASALQWLQMNRDAAAVIVEVQAQSCASFVEELRGLGLTTPVVVVAGSARLELALAALNSGADGYVVAGPSLEADLPGTMAMAIDRERSRRERLTETLTALGAARDRAEQQLARAEEARQQTEQRSASELAAAAARLAQVQAGHTVSLAREARICTALQQRLFELESALRKADERRASEAVSFAGQLAKRHAEFTASLSHAAQLRDVLAAELSVATAALDEARQARRVDAAAAAERLHLRDAELGAALAEAVAARTTLEWALAETEAAHRETRQRAEIDLAAANERQAALEDLLGQEADRRTSLDRELTAAEAAHQEAEQRHASELTRAAARLADLQARHDAAMGENAAARAAFERQSAEAASALERAGRERRSEAAAAAERLAHREAELGAELAKAAVVTAALERALTEAQSAEQQAVQHAADDLASAAAREGALGDRLVQETDKGQRLEQQLSAAEAARQDADRRLAAELAAAATRETDLVERLTRESGARAALERDLAGARMESARRRDRSLHVVSAYRRRGLEQMARLEAQLTGERADADRQLRAKDEEIRQIQQEHETLRHLLGTTQDQLQHLHSTVEEERQALERARSTSESELQRLSAEYGQLRESFDRLQAAFQTLEQIAGEHAAERARLEGVVADRDSQLTAQAERHRVAAQDMQDALAALQERLRQALDASGSEIARLQHEVDAIRRELDATNTHAEALRGVAERVPDLQAQLELSRSERRRQFERAPYALCRCTESGAIADANHAFVTLLGHRRIDGLRNRDFAAAVFDSAGDLSWLLERARTVRRTETIETRWKTREGRQLVVRLQALAIATGSVDIVVEDITGLRALEERLRQAQRMEAVGRLASEVAVTCDALLGDVSRSAHEWLAAIGSDDALRRQGERLLTDVTRAASFLRQLEAYGNEQVRALEPVSAQHVLRDLAPVLKRVVGDQIELVLPKSSGSFDVDVEAERLERILVNVAGYARARMPSGGQISIDLATMAVGRRFVTRYPNVRPGNHVLITVTELPGAGEFRGERERSAPSSDKPGVDLGVLVDLIGTCGGHLWMEAQPAGNMVVKIHLPKSSGAEATDTTRLDARSDRGGRLSRWFRFASAPDVRA
jgi:PAS domain S-box-containing protein